MLRALMLSFQSLSDRPVQWVLAKTMALTAVIFIGAGTGLYFGLDVLFKHFGLGDDMLSILATFIIMALSGALLFRIIAIAILWIFSDGIVDSVEDIHYPQHAARRIQPSIMQSARLAMGSVARVLGYNLAALPLYAVLLFTGIGVAIAFLAVNALLLGRDLEDMLAARHGPNSAKLGLFNRVILGGAGTAAMLLPFINLIVPVIVTAWAVHLVHSNSETKHA